MKAGSFWDFYFGELVALGRDVAAAPALKHKLAYLVMPPGWSHTGVHKTATMVRAEYLAQGQYGDAERRVDFGAPTTG